MSIDRYLYIVRPKSQLRWRTPRHAFFICVIIWASLYSIDETSNTISSLMLLLHLGSFTLIIPYHIISRLLTPGYTACGMNEHENLFICFFPFCSYYAIPLVVIIVCYTNLAMHVIRSGRSMAGHMDTVRDESYDRRKLHNSACLLYFSEKFSSNGSSETTTSDTNGRTKEYLLANITGGPGA